MTDPRTLSDYWPVALFALGLILGAMAAAAVLSHPIVEVVAPVNPRATLVLYECTQPGENRTAFIVGIPHDPYTPVTPGYYFIDPAIVGPAALSCRLWSP